MKTDRCAPTVTLILVALVSSELNAANLTLAWTAPLTDMEGNPLTEALSYKVYVGQNSKSYDYVVDSGTQTVATVSNLQPGPTYYFAVTAYTESRPESERSDEIVWHSMAAAPSFSPSGGVYTGSVTIAASTTTEEADIRFTLDGSEPTTNSTLFTHPITITNDAVLKAISTGTQLAPSPVSTSTYLIYLAGGPIPGNGTLVETRNPRFDWNTTVNTGWYQIWITRNGITFHSEWLNQSNSDWTPDFDFPGGDYAWWIRSWTETQAYTSWEGPFTFTIQSCIPEQPTLISPTNSQAVGTITYEWETDSCSTWYQTWIVNERGSLTTEWHERTGLGATMSADLANHDLETYSWWVRGWSPDGQGPWSDACSFDIGKVQLLTNTSHTDGETIPIRWDDSTAAKR